MHINMNVPIFNSVIQGSSYADALFQALKII